ncbi:MAG TPA: cytochrome d ubiquinol oxidase subunit II, partial [Jatrophihabitans sp.]|nr:cytochrome d ubiquinol oxidase subunit II [Jatrophihabitans sp.]
VWEANHVWLIFCIVFAWTAFPTAFAAVTTTLYLPLGIAAFGIVLRGSGFAFRRVSIDTAQQRANGAAFAISSVLTPFCFGAVAGGLASGRVPTAGHGDAITSWINPTSAIGGALAVLTCGYLAALFLIADARRFGPPQLEVWARRRAVLAAVLCGGVALGGLFVLRTDAHRLWTRLLHVGWPLLLVSGVAGLLALVMTLLPVWRAHPALVRPIGAVAVAAVLVGWGVGQYPFLLGTHLDVHVASAPRHTLEALIGVAVAAALLVGPSLAWLMTLAQRGRLTEPETRTAQAAG